MEIERKYLVKQMPCSLQDYPNTLMEQAYLCISPVVRIRQDQDRYYLTYKGGGMLEREEYNLPLNREAYLHLREKADGILISKRRYRIPLKNALTAELDVFSGPLDGLCMVEVEFPDRDSADRFTPPEWFGTEVTFDPRYHNSSMSQGNLPPIRK